MSYRYGRSSSQTAFRSETPLTVDQIGRYAPSVLAAEAHESRGERYAFIPTIDVLKGLRNEGFEPFEVRQTRCRDLGKREFTKHMVRMRHRDVAAPRYGQGEVPEIVLLNSHDGSSSYQLLAGFFRYVCSNGLIAGNVCNDVRVRHSGHVIDDVIEGSFQVLDNLKEIGQRVETYKTTVLSDSERRAFADATVELRWGADEAGNSLSPITSPDQLIRPVRWEDRQPDAWSTFNVAQEHLITGGVRGRSASGRRTTTREVVGVNENVRLNRALWTLMDSLVRHKNGEEILLAA